MRFDGALIVLIRVQHEGKVYPVGALNRVGLIGNKVLVEAVVAPIDKVLSNLRPLLVQMVGIEHHPLLQHTAFRSYLAQQSCNGGILDVEVDVLQKVRNPRMQDIVRAHLPTLLFHNDIGRCSQVS